MRSFVIAAGMALVMTGCSSDIGSGGQTLDDATLKIVYENSGIYQCGERVFQTGAYWTDELKDPTFVVAEQELTEADSLNGIGGRSTVTVYAPATRSYSQQAGAVAPSWDSWRSTPKTIVAQVTLVKRGDGLQAEFPESPKAQRFTCSNIPSV